MIGDKLSSFNNKNNRNNLIINNQNTQIRIIRRPE